MNYELLSLHGYSGRANIAGVNTTTVTVVTTYPIGPAESLLFGDSTANIVTFQAPDPSVVGREFVVKKIGAGLNLIKLAQFATEKIDNTAATYSMVGSNDNTKSCWRFKSDGTNWWLVGSA